MICNGPFKENIENYFNYRINQKQKISTVYSELNQFNNYANSINCNGSLTKELAENWLCSLKNISPKTLNKRIYALRVFARYLQLVEKETYIVSPAFYQKYSLYIPHIYTSDEIKEIFKQINLITKSTKYYPYFKQQMILLLKLLYCCGFRISELLNLKYKNINFNAKSLEILNSKNNISRIVFITEDLSNNLKEYIRKYSNSKSSEYVFYNYRTNKKMSYSFIIQNFRRIINNSNLNRNLRYRIHDFRHTFAVENIKNVYKNKGDVSAFLPVLMTYMGHSDIKATEYYLRLTPDIYEEITNQYEKNFSDIIPKIEDISNEK